MKFEEVLPALRVGKKIRRGDIVWQNYYGFLFISETENKISSDNVRNDDYKIIAKDLIADDWEIVEEPKKIKLRDLTEEQYKKWFYANCCSKNKDKSISDCFVCVFHNSICNPESNRCWAEHKDLYSNKFLDREIEIGEE